LKDTVGFAQVVMLGGKGQLCAPSVECQVAECFDEMLRRHARFTGMSRKRLGVLHVCERVIIERFILFWF
jgi:hypothetical protein